MACPSGCDAHCANDCSACTGCTGCSSGCSGCTGSCSGCTGCGGCGGGCSGSCSGGCKDSCKGCTGCTGSCTGSCKDTCSTACNAGCTSTSMADTYKIIQNMSDKFTASDMNALRALINYEVETRRGQTLEPTSEVSSETLITAAWWNLLRTNLAKSITVDGSATTGTKAELTTHRQELVDKVSTLYNTIIPMP